MKRKTKQIRLFSVFTAIAVATGCGLLSGNGSKVSRHHINGTLSIEEPSCGSTQTATGKVAVANATYYIKRGNTNHPDSIAFEVLETDAEGRFHIKLPPGEYAVLHADKLMNYGEFRLKHGQTSNYYKVRDEDCFKRWYNAADFLLRVNADTTVQWLVKSRCYTKTNPCLEYTGPK